MGLNERRKIKELRDATFPGRVKEIEEICGKPIPYEVDWDSLADDVEALNFIDNISCQVIGMFKETSLVSVLGVAELLQSTQLIYARTYQTIPLLIVACLWYLIMTLALSYPQSLIEKRYSLVRSRVSNQPVILDDVLVGGEAR